MNYTINVFIRHSRITFSFHFILEIECNLTCEHDGICAKDHNDDLQCFCPQGYSGQYCEHGKRTSILDIPHTHKSIPQSKHLKAFDTVLKILQTPVPQWIATMEALVVLKSTLAPLRVLATMDTMEVTVKKVSIENLII